ncbi:hypothetical protein J7E70_05840 [Variovorax paradoxus]|nr:hypothetical protein [Variovorax paradoxus]MBT2299981.1 hypothetical protein [Variovorax paradoxus]
MRVLGLIGLVLALVIVGLLVRKQMGGVASAAAADPRTQSQQIQQQFKQSLDAAMQQPRPLTDDN